MGQGGVEHGARQGKVRKGWGGRGSAGLLPGQWGLSLWASWSCFSAELSFQVAEPSILCEQGRECQGAGP